MKLRKLSALFLSAAVLTVSAVPMASAAAADFDINLQEEYINDPGDVETVSATFGENGSVTLTLLEGSTTGSGRFMMWTNVDDPFVNLAETPYLCWEVTGTGNFGLAVRYDENVDDSTCYRMQNARGHETDGLAPETGYINFLDLIKNNDLGLIYNADEIMMVAVAMNVFGDVGDSVTFERLYFSASPNGEGGGVTEDTTTTTTEATTATTENTTTTTEATTTTSTTAASTTSGEPVTEEPGANIGLIVGVIAAVVVVAAVVVGVVLYTKKKKKNG